MTGRVRWGIVGTGHMSAGIARAIAADAGSTLRAVVSREPAHGAAFAAAHGPLRVHPSVGDLVAAGDVDALYIGSPNAHHCVHAVEAATGGLHVLADKPLAVSVADARRIVDAAEANGVRVAVNLQSRHHPSLERLRAAIADGAIGRVELIRGSIGFGHETLEGWRADPALAVAAATYNLGVHLIDTVLAIHRRPIVGVTARIEPAEDVDRTVIAALTFDDGAVSSLQISQALAVEDVAIELFGTAGRIRWEGWMAPYRKGRLRIDGKAASLEEPSASPDAYERHLAAFSAAIRDGSAFDPDHADVLRTVEVTQAILDSGRAERAVAL